MSERDEILAAELIAQRLRDPKFQEEVAVSRNRDTGNEDELIQDMRNLNDLEIRAKYGDEGYLASMGQYYTSNEVDQINDRERTTREKWSDIATSAVMATIRSGGNLSGIGAGWLVEKMTDGQISREQATADILSAHNTAVEDVLQENLSETIQDRQRLFQIEGELDSFDNYMEYERDLAEGANPTLAEWRMEGKNFIDSASRALNSGDVTAQLIAEGVGDMALSAPLGGAAGLVVKGLGRTALSKALTTRVGRVMGRVGKAGAYASGDVALEVSGVYAETVQDVMAMENSTLLETSSIYRGLIQEGNSPSEAKAILAGITAETAAIRQAPASVVLGFLTSKFEAMPIGSFRNSGIAGGLLTMAGEGIEEAGQGISGKINQNIAVEEYANIGRRTLEGAGEEAALGAIAGIGTAGVFATPNAPRNVLSDAGKARDALLDFALDGATEYNDPLRQDIMGRDSRAQEAARAATALAVDFGTNVGRGAAAFAGDALKAGEAVGLDKAARATVDAARGATQTAVNTTAEAVNRVNTRDERAQTSKEVEEAVAAARTVDEEIQAGQVTPEVAQSVSNEGAALTPNLSDTVGSNKIETVANIMAKVGSRAFKPTVEDKAFAAAQIKSLAGVMNSLPAKARRQVAKLVTSKAAQTVVKEAGEIDLNKEEVSPEAEVSTTVNVAKSNPANVNPEKTKKILEESGEVISPEDAKYLRVASKVAGTINNLVGNLVSIRETENIGLKADDQAEKEKIDPTARSIYVDGYVNDKGEKLRSINDFASDIIQGAQSPDGTIINQKREVVPVRSVAESFNKMVQHMNNRIGALNQSFDSNTRNSRGKLTAGKGFPFQGLRNGETFVELTSPLYHRDNPASVALAKRIAAERDATVEIYEALQAEFPEIFDGLVLPDLIELKTEENQTQQPTGIEESSTPEGGEVTSTETQTQEENENPTAAEEETNSEEGADETGATATDETVTTEEIDSDEQALSEDEMSDEEIRDLMDTPSSWAEADRVRIQERQNRLAGAARQYVAEMMGDSLKKRIRQLRIYPDSLGFGPGYAHVSEDGTKKKIYLSEAMFDENDQLTAEGRAVLLHEAAHVVDFTNSPKFISQSNYFNKTGKIMKEWNTLNPESDWAKSRMEYANSFRGSDDKQHRAEVFAVLTEFYYSRDESLLADSPEIVAEMETIYGTKTQATGTSTDSTTSEGTSSETGGTTDTTEGSTFDAGLRPNSEFLNEVYPRDENTDAPTDLNEVVQVIENNGGINTVTVNKIVELAPKLTNFINKRLRQRKTQIDGKTRSIHKHILENPQGLMSVMQYKFTALADPETGEMNQNMMELATVAMVDWLTAASQSDPNRFKDTLEKQGLSFADLKSDEQARDMAIGIPPSSLKPQLARAILDMWGVKPNKKSAMVDYYGIAEGLAAEMLLGLEAEGYLEVKRIELAKVMSSDAETGDKEVQHVKTDSIILNLEKVREFQNEVRSNRQDGVSNTVKEYFLGKSREMYSIGEKIPFKKRGRLSARENKAIRTMQDTPHFYNEELGNLMLEIGDENLMRILGFVEGVNEETVPNATLRRSILGKNLSIENNLADAGILTSQLSRQDPVYYPVDVTSVGRHQYQGVNPQSNKFLRALVTPTWTTVDLATQEDAVWLGVAQAADLHKIEKKNHQKILSTVRDDFEARYGEAKNQVLEMFRGNEFDSDAFTASALGLESELEPQVLAAIFTVAKMQHAKETGQTSFESSLSVELDGLTNGAANMMVNFAQGLMQASEWENFKKIGFYIGKVGQTINDYFEKEGNLDMYETVARLAQEKMVRAMTKGKMQREAIAAHRFASHFGDLKKNEKTGQFEMSRNSAKNPMTKVNYGSGVLGVGTGIADDLMMAFFEALHQNELSDIEYEGDLRADLEVLGVRLPENPAASWEPTVAEMKAFRFNVAQTMGQALTEAAKETLGNRITEVNDLLVFSTNVQAAYLNEMFEQKMLELGEELANAGKIRRNPKTNKPVMRDIPVEEYDRIVAELESMAPIFTSDEQTLELGGFKVKIADDWPVLSAAMDDRLNQKPMLKQPDDVGVKAIPFTVIGTGDAMMMNLIFGSDGAPMDVLGVFDGLDVPVTKLQQYAPMVNQRVMETWDRDVLAMAVENFRGFLNNDLDQEALKRAFATAKDKSKKSTVTATSNEELIQQLDIRLQNNRAFKAMLKKVPVSVDQMGGSSIGFSRGEGSLGLNALNDIVRRELEGKPVQTVEEIDEVDVKNPVEETTVSAVIQGIRWSEQQKKVMDIIRPALGDTRVVFGTIDQLNVWRRENVPDDGLVMTAPAQYDPVNEILFMSNARPETILHELVHAGTFQKVLDHYNGQINEAVTRLEGLMDDFMNIQDGGQKVREAQATIARYRQSTDSFAKAAAVNELMAYVLANAAVRKKAQNTQAQSLASIGSKVIRLMRRLLGGAPESIYDGVAFNTQMLIGSPIDDSTGDGGNGDGGGDNAGGEMTPPANNYTNYWIRLLGNYLNENTDTVTRDVRRDEQVRARASVNQIVDSFRQVGMLQNQEARMTFKAIYGVINADIQLRSQPLISMNKMFDHIIENMSPEMFGDGQEAAQEYSAVLNAFGKDNDQINSISVLLALSQTSSKFRQVLDQIPEPETGATGTRLQDTLTAVATKTMDTITARVHENGDAKQVMDMLATTIIEHDQDREWFMLQKVTSSLDAADKYVGGRMQALAEFMRRTDRETRENSRSKVKKFLIGSVTIGTNYLDKTGSDLNNQGLKNQFHMGIPVLSIVPVRELISEIVGTDRFNQKVVALQDKVNHAISGMRQAYREDLPGILANLFQEKPTKTQWKAMYNVIAQTDFVTVIDPNNIAQGMQLLADPAVRSARIRQLETELDRKLVPYVAQDAKDKAEQLANYMTGGGVGTLLVRNAYAIAKNLDGEYDASLVPVLDELISIYAIDMMDADQRQEVLDLYASDQEAMEQIITYLQGLNEEEENKPNISEMARLNAYKGFIPNEGAKDTRIIVADDADELDLKLKGYVKLKPYTGDPSNVVDRSYYITNTRTAGMYAQGTMQNVASTYRGVDANTGLSLGNDTTGFISGDGIVERTMEQLLDAAYVQENPQEGYIPVFAEDGTVMGFERSVNREIANEFLGREENLAIMMGAWAGRQLEETTAYQYNVALIDELDAIWQNRERGSENLFENMKETKDPIYAESFKLIPNNIKSYIDTKFDGQGLMIRKDMTNLAVGYREASLADMWSGKTRMPKEVQKTVQGVTQLFMGRNAMKWIVKVEDIGQGLISTAKDIIVIRSLVVPALNMQANVAQLVTNGVPLKTLKKSMQSKLAEVEQYNKNVTKIIELKAKIRLQARNANQKKILSDKIKAIEDLNKKMTIAPMIAAGAYKQLSEGITEFDENIMSGKLGDYVEAQVAKLPSGVRTIAEHGIVSKSTKIYQIANRATQYGDFLAKSIYYDHLLSQGLAPDVAVARINEEFVNFSTQPGRVRSAMERNGLSWFMAFKLRIAKIAMRQMRDNPVRALAVNAALDVGSPIEDNIFSVMAEGRLDYATGYEMLFAAPELNPWVNLLSD